LPKSNILSDAPTDPVNLNTATAVKPPLVLIFNTREPPFRDCDDVREKLVESYKMAPSLATNVGLVPTAEAGAAARVARDANSWFLLARRTTARASGTGDSAGSDEPAGQARQFPGPTAPLAAVVLPAGHARHVSAVLDSCWCRASAASSNLLFERW